MITHEQISKYIKLNERGYQYIGLCPFHKEKTPSFIVNYSKQIYMCFSCGKKGTLESLYDEIKNIKDGL